MLNVLRNQFRVLQTWMEPIMELASQNPAAKSFVAAAGATEANYQRLLDRLGNDAEDSESTPPPAEKPVAKKKAPAKKKAAKTAKTAKKSGNKKGKNK